MENKAVCSPTSARAQQLSGYGRQDDALVRVAGTVLGSWLFGLECRLCQPC